MAGLYRSIEADVIALFNATWSHADIPVLWRTDDLEPAPRPDVTANFLRNSVLFDTEAMLAFGSGRGANQKCQYGSVEMIAFAARALVSEDTLLELLWDATQTLRSKRTAGSFAGGSDLSFVGDGSGFDIGPIEDGNWFARGCRVVFAYRFIG